MMPRGYDGRTDDELARERVAEHRSRNGQRPALGCAAQIVQTLVLTAVVYIAVHSFVLQPFEVHLSSMAPTMAPGEHVLVDKLSPRLAPYERGDIVVFRRPAGEAQDDLPFIKRIIGLPGDLVSLRNGRVFIAVEGRDPVRIGEAYVARDEDGGAEPTTCRDPACTDEWRVPAGHYFVMGDHRSMSQDSRLFGPIPAEQIVGRAWLRYLPVDRIGVMQRPEYPSLDRSGARLPTDPRLRPRSTLRLA